MNTTHTANASDPDKGRAELHTEHMQLEAGTFVSHRPTIDLSDVFLIRKKTNLRFLYAGDFPGHIAFMFPLNVEEPYLVNECLYNGNEQIVLAGDQKNCILAPRNFEQLTVALRIDSLPSYLGEQEIELLLDMARYRHQPIVDIEHKKRAFEFICDIQQRIQQNHEAVINNESKRRSYSRLIISFLSNYLSYSQKHSPRPSGHVRIIHRGLQYLSSENRFPITLDNLASELFTSKRSIQYAFSKITGKTPREFSKIVMMNRVRNALRDATETENVISYVFQKYNITNPARFKHEYFDFFGEHPKTTISK